MLWYMVHGREQWFFCHRSASTLFFDKLNSLLSPLLLLFFSLRSLLSLLLSFSVLSSRLSLLFLFSLIVYLFVCLPFLSYISFSAFLSLICPCLDCTSPKRLSGANGANFSDEQEK